MKLKEIFSLIKDGEIKATTTNLKFGDLVRCDNTSYFGNVVYCKFHSFKTIGTVTRICGFWSQHLDYALKLETQEGGSCNLKDCVKIIR